MMSETATIQMARAGALVGALALVGYVAVANTLPFGAEREYTSADGAVSKLGPQQRVVVEDAGGVSIVKQIDDLVYFTTPFPFAFDTAEVSVVWRNPDPDQELEVGYKDREEWHYSIKPLDSPVFSAVGWQRAGDDPVLYQRSLKYRSVSEMLASASEDTVIGIFGYELASERDSILGYNPSDTGVVIDTPLRGKHTIYLYLEGEPFELTVTKQDLNWYDDPDVLEVRVFKEADVVFTAVVDDDGDASASKIAGPQQQVTIRNPGPDLPEPGVYRVELDAPGDVLITRIATNLHKVVFASPVFPVTNSEVLPGVVMETLPTVLYTNSNALSVQTYHGVALQDLLFNGTTTPLTQTHTELMLTSTTTRSVLVAPKSDVVVGGVGYFAFAEEQFFMPTKYLVLPVRSRADLDLVQYVLTPYDAPEVVSNGYRTVTRVFDVTDAVPRDGKLSWMVRAPGLKERGGEVYIKDVKVQYTREGWWK